MKIVKVDAIPFAVPIRNFTDAYAGFTTSMKIHPLASEFTELTLLKEHIVNHELKIERGCLTVPDGPGFGVELNESVFEGVIVKLPS